LGYDPQDPACWAGGVAPQEVLAEIRRTLSCGQDVSILATFPSLTGNFPDEAGLAALGSSDGLPRGFFLASDLERDADGWYHLEYEYDARTALPLLDSADQPIRRGAAHKRRITNVIAMQTQLELDQIYDRLSPEKRALFLEF